MKKNQAQKFIVLFWLFLFAYSWRVEAQTGKEKQLTMEFKNEGLPSIFKRFEKVSGKMITCESAWWTSGFYPGITCTNKVPFYFFLFTIIKAPNRKINGKKVGNSNNIYDIATLSQWFVYFIHSF